MSSTGHARLERDGRQATRMTLVRSARNGLVEGTMVPSDLYGAWDEWQELQPTARGHSEITLIYHKGVPYGEGQRPPC